MSSKYYHFNQVSRCWEDSQTGKPVVPQPEFNSRYYSGDDLPPVTPVPSGDGKNPHYRLDPMKDEVIRDGEDDLQSMIEAAEKSCRIDEILRRYRQSGDPALLQQRQAMFGDYTVQEGSYQQFLVLGNQIRMVYDGLSPEDRAKVGSLDNFMRLMSQEIKPQSENKSESAVSANDVKEGEKQ